MIEEEIFIIIISIKKDLEEVKIIKKEVTEMIINFQEEIEEKII
jgi:hypothetical protein